VQLSFENKIFKKREEAEVEDSKKIKDFKKRVNLSSQFLEIE